MTLPWRFWGIWSTPSLSLLLGPLRPGVVAPNRVISKGQIKLFDIYTDVGWLVGWLVGFYDISTFVNYLTPNPFLCK